MPAVNNAANGATLPFGTMNLAGGEYVTSLLGGSIFFGAATLGAYSPEGILVGRATAANPGTMIWTPVATPYDRAANAMSTSPATESGPADREF